MEQNITSQTNKTPWYIYEFQTSYTKNNLL